MDLTKNLIISLALVAFSYARSIAEPTELSAITHDVYEYLSSTHETSSKEHDWTFPAAIILSSKEPTSFAIVAFTDGATIYYTNIKKFANSNSQTRKILCAKIIKELVSNRSSMCSAEKLNSLTGDTEFYLYDLEDGMLRCYATDRDTLNESGNPFTEVYQLANALVAQFQKEEEQIQSMDTTPASAPR